jgi:hypothetical protein
MLVIVLSFSFSKLRATVINQDTERPILPINNQIRAWRRANRKMSWGISKAEFERIEIAPALIETDQRNGFIGVAIFYGFGDDGSEHSDSV